MRDVWAMARDMERYGLIMGDVLYSDVDGWTP